MKTNEIERWALAIAERVERAQPIEDTRVELKSKWPEGVHKTARKIAGHANAAHGEPILWLIGIDEKKREVIGADYVELANWWPQVQSFFAELPPDMTHVNVPYDGKIVVALLFGTERRPFVVKVPQEDRGELGLAKGAGIELEVPWRDGTRTRSAKRQELITVLVAPSLNPAVEVLGGELHLSERQGSHYKGAHQFALNVYIVPQNRDRVVIPFHKCNARLGFLGCATVFPFKSLSFQDRSSPLISCSGNELTIEGPGKVGITGVPPDISTIPKDLWHGNTVQVELSLWPVKSETPVPVVVPLIAQDHPAGVFRKYVVH